MQSPPVSTHEGGDGVMDDVVEEEVEEDVDIVEKELHAASDDGGAQPTAGAIPASGTSKQTANNTIRGHFLQAKRRKSDAPRGVAITFNMWMSRKTEDNLSLDINFMDRGWIWHHYHAGIISYKDSFAGEDIAPLMEPALMEYGL
eukprot:jgi/Tetstr1/455006/TSEL_041864.t1